MNTDRLKELREKKGLTQSQVGEIFGFSNQRYNYYETGKREPDNETIKRFAEYFGVTTDYLLGLSDNPYGSNNFDALKPSKGEIILTVKAYGGGGETSTISVEDWVKMQPFIEDFKASYRAKLEKNRKKK